MAVSPFKTFVSGEVLTASDLNSSMTQITNNGEDLAWPATKAKDLDGQTLTMDSDGDSSISITTDDRLDIVLASATLFRFDGTTASSVNGLDFIGSATGADVAIAAVGTDTNIDIDIQSKGTGQVLVNAEPVTTIIATQVFS